MVVEDLGTDVLLSIRDDGAGTTPDRLELDRADGHLGVSQSIRGRITDLGGTVTVRTAPGEGTEWEMKVSTTMTRVMIVDDHPMWREGVARDLGSRGYDVCATASDVASAVRIALATKPDVVVMDLQLGEGSGVDATREITAALRTRGCWCCRPAPSRPTYWPR